jgi:regulator of protease activity HflC (stomatin/prohibitin superfamily)
MIREQVRTAVHGLIVLPFLLALGVVAIALVGTSDGRPPQVLLGVGVGIVTFLSLCGFFVVNPNEGKVLQLFGDYRGTVKDAGLRWANPFFTKRRVSLRVRNFDSQRLKVNDSTGNPIEIAAVIVWKVVETAQAMFQVDDYENFVHVQTEAAIRHLATLHPYDAHAGEEISLRSHPDQVAEHLQTELQERLKEAGVRVIEARISHLAYAPEIASVMLQRQQASAVVAARQKIVEGAVGMVEMALEMLATRGIVELDAERKAAMVSNLLVVLCGDRGTQPVVNTGTSTTS